MAQPSRNRKRNAAGGALGLIAGNPTAVAGALVMSAMAAAIMTNALTMQPGAHPAPLFHGIRPPAAPEATGTARPKASEAAAAAYDRSLVAAIQTELAARGYYEGAIDGLAGPKTSAAIAAFQKDGGLAALGEPTSEVLAVLKRSRPTLGPVSETIPPPQPPMAPEAAVSDLPAVDLAGLPPLPRPRPGSAPTEIETAAIPQPEAPPIVAGPAAPGEDPLAGLLADQPDTVTPAADAPAPEVAVVVPTVRSVETAQVETVSVSADARPLDPEPRADPRLARIQDALDRLGYGPLKPDGLMSPQTREAIRRFEENRSLPVTGEINEAFLVELMKIGGLTQ